METGNTHNFSYTLSVRDQVNSYEAAYSYRAAGWPMRIIGALLGVLAVLAGLASTSAINAAALIVIGITAFSYLLLLPLLVRLELAVRGKEKIVALSVGVAGIQYQENGHNLSVPWLMYFGGRNRELGVILCFRPRIDVWVPEEVFKNGEEREEFVQFVSYCVRELNRVFEMAIENKRSTKVMLFISRLLGR